jgi:hypothetical protein
MKNIQNAGLTMDMEDKIKQLIVEMGEKDSIRPDGKLNDSVILSYITQNNKRAAKDYVQIVKTYNKLKKDDSFIKESNPRVSKETLEKYLFDFEFLVRPVKMLYSSSTESIHSGEIIKVPEKKDVREYAEGEQWKALIAKEPKYKVGDKILYWYHSIILLDFEILHLVSSISGRILE